MAVSINFTASIIRTNDLYYLRLKDESDLDGITMTNRYWILVNSEGENSQILHDLDAGDSVDILLNRDVALQVDLKYNFNPTDGTSTYSKRKNVLGSPFLAEILYDLRKKFVDILLDKNKEEQTKEYIEDLELIDSCNEASITLISVDLESSQKALDMGNDKANKYKTIIN